MEKVKHIMKTFLNFMKEEKKFILAPILISLALIAFLVYYIGPAIIVSFFYAGI